MCGLFLGWPLLFLSSFSFLFRIVYECDGKAADGKRDHKYSKEKREKKVTFTQNWRVVGAFRRRGWRAFDAFRLEILQFSRSDQIFRDLAYLWRVLK